MQKVELISAPWCARCKTIKPDVITLCQAADVPLTFVDLDDMEEADKDTIKSLPTLRTYTAAGTMEVHTAATLEAWKALIQKEVVVITTGTDF
jgi:thiol-disulfide isomerase/thioredoxin